MAKKPDVVKLPSAKLLQSLVSQAKSNAADIAELKGDYGAVVADAVSKHNLHAGAFKMAKKLAGYDAVKLMAFLTHFDDYRKKLELDVLAGDALPLDDEADEGETDEVQETGDEMIARVATEKAAEQAAKEQAEGAEILDRSNTVN